MITQDKAKLLKIGDEIHSSTFLGKKCEVWKVKKSYTEYPDGWLVSVAHKNTSAGICDARMEEWHFPWECSPPSRELRVDIYRVYDGVRVGSFYISMDDSKEYLERNIPKVLSATQVIAERKQW